MKQGILEYWWGGWCYIDLDKPVNMECADSIHYPDGRIYTATECGKYIPCS